jgi:hypothetical protein
MRSQPVVSRSYAPDEESCIRALAELLSLQQVSKEGGWGSRPDDAERSLSDGARSIVPQES